MSKAVGLLRLLRPINCLMTGLAVLIGEVVTYQSLYVYPSLLGFTTAFTLIGASMVINDYWDQAVDRVNAPDRPLASGLISNRLAFVYAFILVTIGLSSAFLTNHISLLLAVASLLISLLYSYKGKQLSLVGNFMVSMCITIPLIYGSFIYEGIPLRSEKWMTLFFFDLTIFLAVTGREVNKGMADVEGDKIRGVQTIATSYGLKHAAFIATAFYIAAVILSVFPYLLSLTTWLYLPFVAVADGGFLASSILLLHAPSRSSAVKVKKLVLLWMGTGLLAFLMGVPR